MNKLTAVITGVAGQDGSFLAPYLLNKGYTVIGISRPKSVEPGLINIQGIMNHPSFKYIEGDITDATFMSRIIHQYHPHELYSLAAASAVWSSFDNPVKTFQVNTEAVVMMLELIRQISPYTRFFQASTSEMFGGKNCPITGFNEDSPFGPRSPYASSKVGAHFAVKQFRDSYGLFACSGLSFNHSSTVRGYGFATRKITSNVAKIRYGLQKTIKMGNLEARRDEGWAVDYIRGFHLMLQQDIPQDYVFATGQAVSIYEMLDFVAKLAGFTAEEIYEKDERFMRPSDVDFLLGDASKAKKELGWKPTITWQELLEQMYKNDLELVKYQNR